MPESFGARLRQRREERGIALGSIAQQTKIKESLLEGLERDDLSNWPTKLYRRAFVRAYAHAINLDPELVVQEFLERHPDPPEEDVLVAMAMALDRAHVGPRPSKVLRNVVGSAFGSLSRRVRSTSVDNLVVTHGPLGDLPSTHTVADQVSVAGSVVRLAPQGPPPLETVEVVANTAGQYGSEQAGGEHASNQAAGEYGSDQIVAVDLAAPPPQSPEPDLLDVAHLCTEFARVTDLADMQRLLSRAAELLDATGVIVWVWDAADGLLTPAVAHGYSDKVMAQLPVVTPDADNLTAAAFRAGEARAVVASHQANGALVVPLVAPNCCVGVLALELQRGREQTKTLLAVTTILAALIAQLIETIPSTLATEAQEVAHAVAAVAGLRN